METWHDRLDLAMKSRGKKWAELVKITGLSKPSVYAWRPDAKKRTEMMNGDNAAIVCEWLGISSKWLFEGVGDSGLDLRCSEKKMVAADDETPIASATTKNEHQGVSQSLLTEISVREIPPHIEQAILALLQTCPKAAPKQHTPIFTDEQQMQFINEMRDGLPEDRREDFDNFMKYVSSGGQHQFVSKGGGFISDLPPELKRDDDQPRSGDQRDDQLKTSSF